MPDLDYLIGHDEYDDDDDDDLQGEIGAAAYDIVGQDDDDDDDDDDFDEDDLDDYLGIEGMGNTEIVGEEVGARRRLLSLSRRRGGKRRGKRRSVSKRRRRKVARAVIARAAAVVESNPLTRRRRFLLGFTPTTVAAAGSSVIPASPQNLFRAERLVIPSDIAFDFGVQNVIVGTQNQFAQSTEVPGAVFSEVAIDTHVVFDTAEVGNQIAIDVRNKTAGAVEFTAAMLGTLAK